MSAKGRRRGRNGRKGKAGRPKSRPKSRKRGTATRARALNKRKSAPLLLGIILAFVGGWYLYDRGTGATRIMAPKPEIVADAVAALALPASSLAVPVHIDMATLIDAVERYVPVSWGSLDEMHEASEKGGTAAAFELTRSRFEASLVGDTARLSTVITYRARFDVDLPLLPDPTVSCGTGENELPPRLSVEVLAPISLTSEWRLRTKTRVGRIAPATTQDRDRCDVSIVGIDVTDRVVEGARGFLETHALAIDSIVGEVDLRSRFEGWWRAVAEPIRLADDVWLDIRPREIRQGEIHGHGDEVEIHAELEAEPRVVVGARPTGSVSELPELLFGTRDGALDILVEVVGEYDAASKLLTDAVAGSTLGSAGRTVQVDRLELSGIGGGRVALEARVRGDVRGRLYLVGTPSFDPVTDSVSVPDLAFSVSTSNMLVAGASWVADIGLEALLRDRARWRVDPAVDWAADHLAEALNRELAPGVRLEGSVQQMQVLQVAAQTRGLIIGVAATAEATLIVDEGTGRR